MSGVSCSVGALVVLVFAFVVVLSLACLSFAFVFVFSCPGAVVVSYSFHRRCEFTARLVSLTVNLHYADTLR